MDTIYVEKRFYRLKMKAFQIIEEATAELARRKSGGGPPDSVAAPREGQEEAEGAGEGEGEEVRAGAGAACDSQEVTITSRYDAQTRYTNLCVRSRDRPQLLFDTVCTLSDLSVDVFHATIDTDSRHAHLEFFVKSSSGSEIRSEAEMGVIKERLGRALKLGAPPHPGGAVLCLQVAGCDYRGLLHRAAGTFFEHGLNIAYCTSRTDPVENLNTSIFYCFGAPAPGACPPEARKGERKGEEGPGRCEREHGREHERGGGGGGADGSKVGAGALARLSEVFERDLGLGLKELGEGEEGKKGGKGQGPAGPEEPESELAGGACCKTSCAKVVALIEKLWIGTTNE